MILWCATMPEWCHRSGVRFNVLQYEEKSKKNLTSQILGKSRNWKEAYIGWSRRALACIFYETLDVCNYNCALFWNFFNKNSWHILCLRWSLLELALTLLAVRLRRCGSSVYVISTKSWLPLEFWSTHGLCKIHLKYHNSQMGANILGISIALRCHRP